MIPLCKPFIEKDEINSIIETLNSGWLAHGPRVKEFERMFADFIGTKHAISFNSCTSALQIAIQSLGIDGEVILPSFTFVASANAVVTAGAKPVFVDIEEDTFNISPSRIEEKITGKTQAIMPVHIAGHPCDMGNIMKIAENHNLHVIEDSAECIGGKFMGKNTGSFGTGCFSFYPTKNITTGEGGMITTDNDGIAEKSRTIKAHGIPTDTIDRENRIAYRNATAAGYNFRMSDINAAIGIEQMRKLDSMNRKRVELSSRLTQKISNKIKTPVVRNGYSHVFQMYIIKIPENVDREEFVISMRENGIQASIHFSPPVHLQDYYKNIGWAAGDLPVTERVSNRIVTLPMFPSMNAEDVDLIAEKVNSLL